uniref:Uncharacterized protein n=1 Tax=Arundo donax TaxID=35708 RepID=A0A0A9BAB7_ARUDO
MSKSSTKTTTRAATSAETTSCA